MRLLESNGLMDLTYRTQVHASHSDEKLPSNVLPTLSDHSRNLSAETAPHSDCESDIEGPRIIAGRYRVIARLGGGSFGDVYRVSDEFGSSDGGREFALKVLRSADPVALRYFKREFRCLADVYHPNIARLYELIASDNRWLFTMGGLVHGLGFLRYLASQSAEERDTKLRSCLLQLAEGL